MTLSVAIFCLIALSVITNCRAQVFIDCPLNWFSFENNCYKFNIYPHRTYEEAVKTCEAQGAGLLSVNTAAEHEFIDTTLKRIDPTRSLWFTSGVDLKDKIKWNGDGTVSSDDANNFWASEEDRQSLPIIVIYKYSVTLMKYGWGKANGDNAIKFICEIPKSETSRIIQESRDFTYGSNITDPTLAPRGPKFTIQPESIVLTNRSYLPSIECEAEGNPQPTHTWHRIRDTGEENVIVANEYYTISNGKLAFDKVNEVRDAGTYYCVAENSLGAVRSEPAEVTFGSITQFPNVAPGTIRAALYQGTYLNCNPPAHKPALTYQWRKDHDFLQPILNNYFFISAGGNLYFSEVQQSDGGSYHCIVTLAALPGERLATSQPTTESSLAIRLYVAGETASQYPPDIHDDFPAVFPKTPLRGQTITIECLAYGRLPLRYTWTKKGNKGIPTKASTRDFSRVLVIPDVQFEDEGTYTCTVKGRSLSDNKDFLLTIGAKPYFIFPLRDKIADEDSDITWRCEGIASPRAAYTWYKNAKPLQPVPGQIEISSNVLRIKNLKQKEHSGMYSCVASNTHGTSVTDAQLTVLSLAPSFAKSPLPLTVLAALNGNLTIPCMPEAAPAPTITWMKNGAQMNLGITDGNQQGAQQLINGYLKIVGVQMGDTGLYTCEASNKNGKAQSTGKVTVEMGVSITVRPLPNIPVQKNNTLFIPCEASYDSARIDLVYLWNFNGKNIDFDRQLEYEKGSRTGVKGLYLHFADYFHSGVYECVALTTITKATVSTNVIVNGPPGMPGNVYRVKGSETSHSITLKWTKPPEHGSAIQQYFIEARTVSNPTWRLILRNISDFATTIPGDTNGDKRQFLVEGLIPFNSYEFRVYAKNGYLEPGEYSMPSDEFRIKGDRPIQSSPNVTGGGGSVGVLTIKWQLLTKEYKCGPNFGYYVYWRRNTSTSEFQVRKVPEDDYYLQKAIYQESDGYNRTAYTVNLNNEDDFYLPFEVKIGVFNAFGDGPNSTSTVIYSAEGIPMMRPTNVNGYELNSTALWVTWDPMPNTREAVKGVIQGFEINVEDFNDPFRKSVTAYHYGQMSGNNVIGLEPNSDFWVTVQVFNTAGQSNPSERQRLSTCFSAPFMYPEFVNIYSDGPHSVYVEWRGVSTGLLEETLRGYKMKWWLMGDDIKNANETTVGLETHGTIYGLAKGYVYALRVAGFSHGGDGKMSPTKYFTLGGRVQVDSTLSDIRLAGHSIQPSLLIVTILLIVQVTL